jgi:hypothetical protein
MRKTENRTETNKRAYVAPRIEAIPIEMEGTILAGSNVNFGGAVINGKTTEEYDFGGSTSSNVVFGGNVIGNSTSGGPSSSGYSTANQLTENL